jgi:hypothetical protein
MSADAHTDLDRLLEQLDEEERLMSAERQRLQDRIDYFAGSDDVAAAAEVEQQERALSARRRELHSRIEALRGPRSDGE